LEEHPNYGLLLSMHATAPGILLNCVHCALVADVASQETLAICQPKWTDGATPHTVQCAWAGMLSVLRPSLSKSLADYLRDPALGLDS